MKYINLTFLLFAVLFTSCEKRTCQCADDITITTVGDIVEKTLLLTPNAVFAPQENLRIVFSTTQSFDFSMQRLVLSQDGEIFIDVTDLTPYRQAGRHFDFPRLLYADGSIVLGAVDVDLQLSDGLGASISVVGTVYFYGCGDIDSDFDSSDCRFSSQLVVPLWGEWPLLDTDC